MHERHVIGDSSSKLPSTAACWAGHWYICTGAAGRVQTSVHRLQLQCDDHVLTYLCPCIRYADFDSFLGDRVLSEERPFWTDYFHYHQMWFQHSKTGDNILLVNYDTMQLDLAAEFNTTTCRIPWLQSGREFRQLRQHLAPFLVRLHEATWGVVRAAFGTPHS